MVLIVMKSIFKIIILGILIIFFSCEDKGWYTNCSDCTTTEPDMANLAIRLSNTGTPVKVKIYEGELEDSVILSSATPWSSVYNFSVVLNKKFTVTATYSIDNKSYTAVDSAFPRVKYTETQCEEACYFVYDNELDMRLKYTAK